MLNFLFLAKAYSNFFFKLYFIISSNFYYYFLIKYNFNIIFKKNWF